MHRHLEENLIKEYPKIFQSGEVMYFDHRDGWYNLLDRLCASIQEHIDRSRLSRARALWYNRALIRAQRGDKMLLLKLHGYTSDDIRSQVRADNEVARILDNPISKPVPPACPQVAVLEVKEKFGSLRFYYVGGDDIVDKLVELTESLSAVTCESCGSPGKKISGNWAQVLCPTHAAEREMKLI
jgi:hypothetical protein